MKKTCGVCRRFLPLSDFYRRSDASDGAQSRCKTCTVKSVRYRRAPNGSAEKQLSVRIPAWVHAEIKDVAEFRGVSMSVAVTQLIAHSVETAGQRKVG